MRGRGRAHTREMEHTHKGDGAHREMVVREMESKHKSVASPTAVIQTKSHRWPRRHMPHTHLSASEAADATCCPPRTQQQRGQESTDLSGSDGSEATGTPHVTHRQNRLAQPRLLHHHEPQLARFIVLTAALTAALTIHLAAKSGSAWRRHQGGSRSRLCRLHSSGIQA